MQLCTMYPFLLHPKYKLYIPRKDGGRGLTAIQDCIELAVGGLGVYVHGWEERLILAARGDRADGSEEASVLKKAKRRDCKIERKKLYMASI